jgi:mannose-6-phosphate isomerase-like protein (cupin superfamily)
MLTKVNLAQKFSQIHEYWKPYIAGELNGQLVKFDKLKGEFVWHHHENEDEMFLVVKGRFRIEFRDQTVGLEEGEFIIVPRGVEHRPVADEECWILLFEPASTLNTGNVENDFTVRDLERVCRAEARFFAPEVDRPLMAALPRWFLPELPLFYPEPPVHRLRYCSFLPLFARTLEKSGIGGQSQQNPAALSTDNWRLPALAHEFRPP